MAGLVPVIHAAAAVTSRCRTGSAFHRRRCDGPAWVAGTSPAMTVENSVALYGGRVVPLVRAVLA
jgi:hypothetical protein